MAVRAPGRSLSIFHDGHARPQGRADESSFTTDTEGSLQSKLERARKGARMSQVSRRTWKGVCKANSNAPVRARANTCLEVPFSAHQHAMIVAAGRSRPFSGNFQAHRRAAGGLGVE